MDLNCKNTTVVVSVCFMLKTHFMNLPRKSLKKYAENIVKYRSDWGASSQEQRAVHDRHRELVGCLLSLMASESSETNLIKLQLVLSPYACSPMGRSWPTAR
jgi:hypothetical protein